MCGVISRVATIYDETYRRSLLHETSLARPRYIALITTAFAIESDRDVNQLPTYQYNYLQGPQYVRLVELFTRKENEVINWALRQVSLGSKPSFEALSYVLGDTNDLESIICDDFLLAFTKELGQTLRSFRSGLDGPIANAINQQEIDE